MRIITIIACACSVVFAIASAILSLYHYNEGVRIANAKQTEPARRKRLENLKAETEKELINEKENSNE